MRANNRAKIALFVCIFFISMIGGIVLTAYDTRYRKFSVEKHPLGASIATTEQIETASDEENGKVNINTNNAAELDSLDGIGASMAERIISYRKSYGDFEVIEDLMRVSGIGEKKFDAIKDKIYVK